MNGVTRLMLVLGTVPLSNIQTDTNSRFAGMTTGISKQWIIGSTHINFPGVKLGTPVVLREGAFVIPPV